MKTDSRETSLSRAVIDAVAAREGRDAPFLDDPLYETVDPESLDGLFRGTAGSVTFEYHGYIVTVDSEGDVDLTDAHRP